MRKINEDTLNNRDVEDVFKAASELKPGKKGFLGIGSKKGLTVSDIRKAWADAGYPEESRPIIQVLKSLGYDRKEINKIFKDLFDTKHGKHDTGNSEVVGRLANYITKNGYTSEILDFMEHQFEFDESTSYDKSKLVVEEVRDLFDRIIKEQRSGLPRMQRDFNQQHLGRQRK